MTNVLMFICKQLKSECGELCGFNIVLLSQLKIYIGYPLTKYQIFTYFSKFCNLPSIKLMSKWSGLGHLANYQKVTGFKEMGKFAFFYFSVKIFQIVQFFGYFCSRVFLRIFVNLEFI